jgi:hypothetical protein
MSDRVVVIVILGASVGRDEDDDEDNDEDNDDEDDEEDDEDEDEEVPAELPETFGAFTSAKAPWRMKICLPSWMSRLSHGPLQITCGWYSMAQWSQLVPEGTAGSAGPSRGARNLASR